MKDIRPGPEGSLSQPFRIVGDTLYIVADDGVHGSELWRSDGTEEGTSMIADIWPGPIGSSVRELSEVDGEIWFSANDGTHGHEPWRFDGEQASLVADLRPGRGGSAPRRFHGQPWGPGTVFIANDGRHGDELWFSDPSSPAPYLFEVFPGPHSGAVSGFSEIGDRLVFTGRDPIAGDEPWMLRRDPGRENPARAR